MASEICVPLPPVAALLIASIGFDIQAPAVNAASPISSKAPTKPSPTLANTIPTVPPTFSYHFELSYSLILSTLACIWFITSSTANPA